MADYWKSNPRKFCDICKCWMADNKISIQNHETGMRHKANVEKKMNEIMRNNKNCEKEKQKLQDNLQKINDAAFVGMMKDIERDPSLAKRYGIALTDVAEKAIAAKANAPATKRKCDQPVSKPVPKKVPQYEWQEFTTQDGKKYYYNLATKVTQWERPTGSIAPEVVSSKVEKERHKQFLMNRLVELSESGSEIATKAIFEAFGGETTETEPEVPSVERADASKHEANPVPSTETDSSSRVNQPYRGPKVDLLGQWVPVEDEPAKHRPQPQVNLPSVVENPSDEVDSTWYTLARLEATTETSIQNMRHLEVAEKQVAPGSLSKSVPQKLEANDNSSTRNVPRVVFRRGPLSTSSRNFRTTNPND